MLSRSTVLRCTITDSGHLALMETAAEVHADGFAGSSTHDVQLDQTATNGADAHPFSVVAVQPTAYCHDAGTIGWEHHAAEETMALVNEQSQALRAD